jgi:hypothetical protein
MKAPTLRAFVALGHFTPSGGLSPEPIGRHGTAKAMHFCFLPSAVKGIRTADTLVFRATTLLKNDWHLGVIGALLEVTWSGLSALRDQALPASLPVRG